MHLSIKRYLKNLMKSAIALAILSTAVSAQSSCSASCKGTTSDGTQFDLSALMGQDYQTVGSDQNGNFFNLFLTLTQLAN